MRSRIILFGLLFAVGVGLVCLLPSVKREIAKLDGLISDAEEMLKDHRSAVIVQVTGPDELETALEVHRMSYLARRDEMVMRTWTLRIGGPLCMLIGLVGLIHAAATARPRKRRRKRVKRRRRVQRR